MNRGSYIGLITVLSFLFMLHLNHGCSHPLKKPAKDIIGHWVSEDRQKHFYFSEKGLLVITDQDRNILFTDKYHIGIVVKKAGKKIEKRTHLYFYQEFSGKYEGWITFSEDSNSIDSDAFGKLNYVDSRQNHEDVT